MEVMSAIVFIGAVIIGVTQLIRLIRDKNYDGAVLILVAALIGALVGVFDIELGLTNISVAQGIMAGFGAAGTVTTAEKIG